MSTVHSENAAVESWREYLLIVRGMDGWDGDLRKM